MTSNLPYFLREDDRYLPTEASRGYWTPDSLNGRLVVGLTGFEIERVHGDPDWLPARLTVDMYRLPTMAPIEVTTRVVRAGGRLKLIEADFLSDGQPMARASCQFLRRTAPPQGTYWPTPGWQAPPPEQAAPWPESKGHWDMRAIDGGGVGTPWPRRVWLREIRDLVAGFPLTPFARAAAIADFSSPLANSGEGAIDYINTDVTLYLSRLPIGEWIGAEASFHQNADGIAHGVCWLHDERGPIGSSSTAGIVQTRRIKDD